MRSPWRRGSPGFESPYSDGIIEPVGMRNASTL
jgi:hypothetical protein